MPRAFQGPARWDGGKKSVLARGTHEAQVAPVIAEPTVGPNATDAAKAFAAEHSVDLAEITGTGSEGRITKDDVVAWREEQAKNEPAPEVDAEPELEPVFEPIPDEADLPVAPLHSED